MDDDKSLYVDEARQAEVGVLVPELEVSEARLEALREVSQRLEQKVIDEVLPKERCFDLEDQVDHLAGVETNVVALAESALGRKLNEAETLRVKVTNLNHDRGKWEGSVVKTIRKTKPDLNNKILGKLGLSKGELELFENGIEGKFHEGDIAHHIFSAYLFLAEFEEGGVLQGVDFDPEDKRDVLDAILSHQFGGYYQDSAKSLNVGSPGKYSQDAISAIRREIKLDTAFKVGGVQALFAEEEEALRQDDYKRAREVIAVRRKLQGEIISRATPGEVLQAAFNDGDKINMAQVGLIDTQGQFRRGGYLKILGISVNFLQAGSKQGITSLNDCFASCDNSVAQVEQETTLPLSRRMMKYWRSRFDVFQSKFFGPSSGYQQSVDDLNATAGILESQKISTDGVFERAEITRNGIKSAFLREAEVLTKADGGYVKNWKR